MLKRSLILIALAIMATPAMAQTSFYTDRALQQVNVLTSPTPLTAAIPYGPVRVCSLPLTQQSPCLPLATITDVNGNPISNSIGPLFGQLTTDATGRYTFGCTNNVTYQVQVAASASNTPAVNYPITCPGGIGAAVSANNAFTGNNSFTNITLSGAAIIPNANNTRAWDGVKYPYTDTGLRAVFSDCVADAQCTFIDGRNFLATTLASPAISITNKTIELWLGPATLTCANTCFNFGNGTDGSGITCFGNCTLSNSSTTGAHTIIVQGTGGTYARMLHFRGLRFTGASGAGDGIHAVQSQNIVAELNLFDGSGSSAISLTKSLEWNIRNNFIEGTYTFYAILLQSDGTAAGGSNENWVTFNTINGSQNGCTDIVDSSYNVIAFNDEATCVNAADVDMNQISSSVAAPVGNLYYHNVGETGVTAGDFLHCNGGVGFGPIGTVYDGNQFGALGATRVMLRVDRCDQTSIVHNRLFETQAVGTTAFVNGSLATNTEFGNNYVPSTNTTYLTDSGASTWGCLSRICTQWTSPNNVTNTGLLTVGGTATFTAASTIVANGDVQVRASGDTFARIQLRSSDGAVLLGPGNASTHLLLNNVSPAIAAAGCGGAAAAIVAPNGTAAFKINVGTTPGSACTITMPSATTGWNVHCEDITTQSTSVFVQKQTGAESTTSVTITNFNDVAVATAFVASDILKCTASAD